MKQRGPLIVGLVLLLIGLAPGIGAYVTYSDQHSGTPGQAEVSSCEGFDGRYSGGVHCTGSWIVGGSLLEGGHVVVGAITNADRDDIGKTIDVRIHGDDHATKPELRISIILAVIALLMLGLGGYLALTSSSRSSGAKTSGSASS